MKASSPAQFAASRSGEVPPLERVREGIWALGTAMPGGHIPYSLLYLVRDTDGGIHIVDPGWDSDTNWDSLVAALASIGASVSAIQSVTVTHLHPDHVGMAQRVHLESGAPVQMHATEARDLEIAGPGGWSPSAVVHELDDWMVPDARRAEIETMLDHAPPHLTVEVGRLLQDGDRLDIPGFDLIAMLTPGHTAGSVCIRGDAQQVMLTGDVLLPTMHGGLGLGGPTETNPLQDYLASLDALKRYPDHEVLPGHGYRFTGLLARADKSAAHHLKRTGEVAAVLADDPGASVWDIASRLTWTAGWDNLSGFFAYSALWQTAMHREYLSLR